MILEIVFGLLLIFLVYFLLNIRSRHGMPPGEFGWPVVGYSPSNKVSMIEQVEGLKKKHGKTFTWKMGSRYFVFLCDYKVIKAAFATSQASHRPEMYSFDIFSDFKRIGFVNNVGQSIQNLRRFTLTYLRNSGMGKSSLENVIIYELEYLIEDFSKHCGKPLEIPWSLNVAVINVLWKMLADKRFDIKDENMHRFEKLITEIFNDAQNPLVTLFDTYPMLSKIFPLWLHSRLGMKDSFDRIEELVKFLRNSINEHRDTLDAENPRDYIDAFLIEMIANEKGMGTERNFNFTYKELLYSLSDMFSAGSETTSSTFRWLILYLVKYPEVQKKVHQEIDSILPRDRLPTYTDKEKLVYTQAVINEVMRLAPIAPFGLQHSVDEDFVIDGFRIPKGAVIIPAVYLCHFDPDYWEEPKQFKPERFIKTDGTVDINKEGFTPFLTGRRACIGESLARMQLFFYVTGILQKFVFTVPEGEKLSTEPNINQPFFMMPPSFKIIMTERK